MDGTEKPVKKNCNDITIQSLLPALVARAQATHGNGSYLLIYPVRYNVYVLVSRRFGNRWPGPKSSSASSSVLL